MSILIGIKGADCIRYISIQAPQDFTKVQYTLKIFYKTTELVKALIELGNLEYLGSNPYKKNKGDNDIINCESRIRDKKLSALKHCAQSIKNDEKDFVNKANQKLSYYNKINCCFLFADNQWYVLVRGYKEKIERVDESFLKKDKLMDGLKVYKYDPTCSHSKLDSKEFHSWNEIKRSANEKSRTYYVFRGNKFIKRIEPCITNS